MGNIGRKPRRIEVMPEPSTPDPAHIPAETPPPAPAPAPASPAK